MKTRLCHSVWTKPMMGKRWNIDGQLAANLWLFALSVHYAKKVGAEIVLHTDELGESLYGFLPYDNIFRTLDKVDAHERFWAAGKIWAQEAEPLGSIHIDGDVFIKTAETLMHIGFEGYDLICQNKEAGYNFGDNHTNKHHLFLALAGNYPERMKFESDTAVNCGLVGFNSQELKDEYIRGYKQMLYASMKSTQFISYLKSNLNSCPDLFIEQQWLDSLANCMGCHVKHVFPKYENMHSEAVKIGYTHVLGSQKYSLIGKVKDRLYSENPVLWNKTENQVNKVVNQNGSN